MEIALILISIILGFVKNVKKKNKDIKECG